MHKPKLENKHANTKQDAYQTDVTLQLRDIKLLRMALVKTICNNNDLACRSDNAYYAQQLRNENDMLRATLEKIDTAYAVNEFFEMADRKALTR